MAFVMSLHEAGPEVLGSTLSIGEEDHRENGTRQTLFLSLYDYLSLK